MKIRFRSNSTGAAVADIDNDGVLELLVSHGESFDQPLSLYKAKIASKSKYLRVKPLNEYGAPARGATVTLISNLRKHSKTIDAGSAFLDSLAITSTPVRSPHNNHQQKRCDRSFHPQIYSLIQPSSA